jgi:hypothetical protein
MVSIPFYYVARDVIGFLRSLQPATKLPGADTRREEKVNSPLFEIARLLVRFFNHDVILSSSSTGLYAAGIGRGGPSSRGAS